MTNEADRPAVAADILHRSGHPVQRIVVEVPHDYNFEAGQYLCIEADGIAVPLSIASAPERLPELELHYRSTPGLREAEAVDELLTGSQLPLSPAQGDVRCGAPREPLLIIAGGSGAAQAFACAEHRAAHR